MPWTWCGALFENLPDRLTVGHSLSVCGTAMSGQDENGEIFILVESQDGGWGAGATKDGGSGLVVVGDGDGDPLCRDRDAVRWDIENEFLTA